MDKNELFGKVVKRVDCDNCIKPHCLKCGVESAYDILKEAGMLKEDIKLPVVKTWTLKKDIKETLSDLLPSISSWVVTDAYDITEEPEEKTIKYFDCKEEVDYSQIPEGSIVEFSIDGCTMCSCIIVKHEENSFWYGSLTGCGNYGVHYSSIKSFKIIRWGKNG